jgi:hypothetical protein
MKRRFTDFATADEGERFFLTMSEAARMHTQVWRNWGFPQHMREIILDLFGPLDEQIQSLLGLSAKVFMSLADGLAEISCQKAMDYFRKVRIFFRHNDIRNVVREFCNVTGTSLDDMEHICEVLRQYGGNVRDKKIFLTSFLHSTLPSLFTFTLDDCLSLVQTGVQRERLKSLLNSCSFEFGDLRDDNAEHLIMQSKIQTKPLIRVAEETYFLPVSGLFNSFFVQIMESLIWNDHKLKAAYHDRRAQYLEESLSKRLFGSDWPSRPRLRGKV